MAVPLHPSSLTISAQLDVSSYNVDISWVSSLDATGYTLYYSSGLAGQFSVVSSNITALTYHDTDVALSSNMYYKVYSENGDGQSTSYCIGGFYYLTGSSEEQTFYYSPNLVDDDGWTVIPEPTTGRKVYVDATLGDDSNDGLSEGFPKKTISSAFSLIRDGYDDHLLLKRGEVWNESLTSAKSGISSEAPIVFGTYGEGDRPVLTGFISQLGGGRTAPFSNTWIVGWHFKTNRGTAISLLVTGENILIEDCYCGEENRTAITIQGLDGPISNVTLKRCVFVDSHIPYASGIHQGSYFQNVSGLNYIECYLDLNGWHPVKPAHESTIYNHNIYIQHDCSAVTVSGIWSSRASSHGIQIRPGGGLYDSSFYKNSINSYVGDAEGVYSYIKRNVTIEGKDMDTGTRGWEADFSLSSGGIIQHNIWAHQTLGTGPVGVQIRETSDNVTFIDNISFNWNNATVISETASNVVLSGNDIYKSNFDLIIDGSTGITESLNNRFFSSGSDGDRFEYATVRVLDDVWLTSVGDVGSVVSDFSSTYPNPTRNMDNYAQSIGLPTGDDVANFVRLQRKGNWDSQLATSSVVSYFQSNFGLNEVSTINIQLSANRLSGVAPFNIHLDMGGTSATGITFPGLDIEYLTDWGDSGSYIPSSHGVVAAHVYETPGEYTVTVSGIIPSSLEITTSSFTVTAIDPDTYYSGTATVCISNDTDFTGSSVDCSTVTLTDISQLASYCGSGIRTLLKRGVTWDLTANTTIPDGSYIGVFGTATGERTGRGCYENDPIIDYGYTSTLFQINDTNGADYTVLKNIHFFNGDVSSGNLVTMTGDSSAKNVLIHQCTFSRYATAAGTSNDLAAFADKVSTPYFCISKSEFYPASFSLSDAEGLEGSTFGIYIGGYGQAVIGNYFPGQESFNDLSGYHSHVFRSIYSHKLAIQKNYFGGIQNSTRHILKLHHVLFGAASSLTNQTDYGGDICITENTYSGINNTWAVVPGPADTRDMRLSGIYIANERAYTASDGGVSQMYAPFARDVRIKNCFLRDYSTGYSHHFVYAGNRGDDPAASGLEVYNCTYRTGSHSIGHESSFIEIASTSGYDGSAIVRNCVIDWDSGGEAVPLINPASDSSKLISSNIHLSSDGDAGFTNSDSGNFTLLSSSPLIGAGISGVSYFDIDGRIRDTNETEIGAYEYFSTESIMALTINSIVTNKLIGPTPLAVHCDATDISGSSYDDPQRDVVFLWDWGDPTNYNNSSIGCCAACVYENSGTFTVSVTALDLSSGLSDTSSFNISAYSPDEYYAGSSTIVFSPSGDFTDAPTGAIQVTTSSINDIVSYGGEGNRLLLQRGATFYASATPEVIDGTYMDAYQAGTGETSEGAYDNDPIIDWEGQSLGLTLLSANGASGTWINHIHTLSGATEFYGGIGIIGGDAHSNNLNVTIAHCHVDRCGIGIGVNSDLAVYYGEAPTPYFCVYRNKVTPYYTAVDGATTNHACYASGKGLMLLGNNFYGEISGGPGYTDSHCCRVTYAPKAVIENNQFYPSQNFSRHSLKFHTLDYPTASGLSAVDDVARDICITKNSFIAANIWILAVGPQDSINDERIDGVYFAQNTISAVNYMNAAHYIAARNVKIESTTVISETIGWDTHFARCEKRGLELDPSGLRIYNSVLYYNTDYNEGEAGFVRLLADYSGSATVKNCVAATTGGTETFPIVPVVGSLTTIIQESNIESDTAPGFIEASAGNFGLLSSSTLIDTGVDVPVYQDLSGSTWTGTYEIGAVQYTSSEPVIEHNATATIILPSLGITASAEVSSSPGQTTISATADITLPSLGISISANNQVLPGIPSSINVYLETPNINIGWGAATSAVSYTVEMDLASSGYSELSSGITSPLSATVAYPGVGTQRFRVYATNPNGDGGTIQGFLYTAPVTPSFMGTGRGFLGKSLMEIKLSL